MVTFDLKDAPEDLTGGKGQPRVQEGKGMFLVTKVEELPDYIKVVSEVVAHEDEDSIGQIMYDRLSTSGKFAHRGLLFARACGILTDEGIKKAQAEKQELTFEVEDLFGRAFCASIVHRATDTGTFANFRWDYTTPAEGKATGYPVDAELI